MNSEDSKTIGRIDAGVTYLTRELTDLRTEMQENFKGLECKQNTEKIQLVHSWYLDQKESQRFVSRTIIAMVFSWIAAIGTAVASAVFMAPK